MRSSQSPQSSLLSFCLFFCLIITTYASPDDVPNNIPPDIREQLDLAEDMRCTAHYDKAIQHLEKAQELYLKKGDELAGLELYSKILWMAIDTDFDSEAFLKRCAKATSVIQPKLAQYPQLEAILLMAKIQETWIDDNIERAEKAYQQLSTVLKKYPNWDYEAAAASHMSSIFAYCTSDADKIKFYVNLSNKLIEQNTKGKFEKDAHLFRLYPYYIFYNYDNLAYTIPYDEKSKDARLNAYNQLFEILKQQKKLDSLHYSKNLIKMGDFYSARSDEDKAIEYYENALMLISPNLYVELGLCEQNIGDAYITQAKDDKAIIHYLKSIAHFDKEKNPSNFVLQQYVDVYRSMATSYVKLNEFKKAKVYLEKIGKFPAGIDKLPSWTYATWGFLYEYTKEYDKAIAAHEQSIIAYKKEGSDISSAYWNLGKIAYAQKDYKGSVEYFHKGLVEDNPGINPDFRTAPKLEEIRRKHSAITTLTKKLRSYYAYVEEQNLWVEHGPNLLALSNLTVECFEYMRASFDSKSSKESLLETAYYTYEQAISTYLNLYEHTHKEEYLKKALEFAEKSKSVLLEDALKEGDALSFGGVPDSLIAQEQNLKSEITKHERSLYLAQKESNQSKIESSKKLLFESRLKADKLKHIFEKTYPKYYELKYAKTIISIDKVQQGLDEKTAILEYFEGYDHVFVFSITKSKLNYLRVPVTKDYSSQIERLRNSLSNSSLAIKNPIAAYDMFVNSAFDFHKTYIKNILPKEANRLIIIPDGLLNYVAFEALIKEIPAYTDKQDVDYKKLPYLINQYTVSYNYSAMMWLQQLNKPTANNNHQLLAMAAVYDKEFQNKNGDAKIQQLRNGLSPIPGTIEEIKELEKVYGGAFYTHEAANEQLFKKEASNYGILHLAMHGISNSEHPEFSSMAFTEDGQNTEDNFLHINEIKQLNLNADLVVLSACETGFGKYQHGEGVVSLGRSFMYAGAPSIVMTLWNINDHSSVYIIQLFYQYLQQGLDKDQALQKAKQDYINQVSGPASHPAFWAAFVQLGDYKPITIASQKTLSNWGILGFMGLGLLTVIVLFKSYKQKIA